MGGIPWCSGPQPGGRNPLGSSSGSGHRSSDPARGDIFDDLTFKHTFFTLKHFNMSDVGISWRCCVQSLDENQLHKAGLAVFPRYCVLMLIACSQNGSSR